MCRVSSQWGSELEIGAVWGGVVWSGAWVSLGVVSFWGEVVFRGAGSLIIKLLENIINQNYFSFQDQTYQTDKAVAMGSPISGTMAEIFLQQLENTHVKHLIEAKLLFFYIMYVDDILVIYDSTLTTPDSIQRYLSTIHNNIQLNPTHENNFSVSFLDLIFTRKPSHLDIDIHRKNTTTDTTINFLSNHPPEHKLAAYRFLIRRMFTLPVHKEQRHEEWQNILHTAHRNNFPRCLITNLKHRIKKKLTQPSPPTTSRHDTKWTTFTYTSPQIRKITNLFKNTNIKLAFKCNDTIA